MSFCSHNTLSRHFYGIYEIIWDDLQGSALAKIYSVYTWLVHCTYGIAVKNINIHPFTHLISWMIQHICIRDIYTCYSLLQFAIVSGLAVQNKFTNTHTDYNKNINEKIVHSLYEPIFVHTSACTALTLRANLTLFCTMRERCLFQHFQYKRNTHCDNTVWFIPSALFYIARNKKKICWSRIR